VIDFRISNALTVVVLAVVLVEADLAEGILVAVTALEVEDSEEAGSEAEALVADDRTARVKERKRGNGQMGNQSRARSASWDL
jgi:hypothetical protein